MWWMNYHDAKRIMEQRTSDAQRQAERQRLARAASKPRQSREPRTRAARASRRGLVALLAGWR